LRHNLANLPNSFSYIKDLALPPLGSYTIIALRNRFIIELKMPHANDDIDISIKI